MSVTRELTIVGIVLFIAAGLLVFIMAFIVAKRQISRFATRGAQKSIGSGAPKMFKKQIMEKLNRVSKIKYEPTLLNNKILSSADSNHYLYRMKAMDAFSKFDETLKIEDNTYKGRHPNTRVRWYLTGLKKSCLSTCPLEVINEFSDAYEHARHSPEIFGESEYDHYMKLLNQLIDNLKKGFKLKSLEKTSGVAVLDSKVSFDQSKKNKIKTEIVQESKHTSVIPVDLRLRTRSGSSGHSSLLDSGHSSQPSSERTDRDSPEKIALVELSTNDKENLV
ncbi:protein C1orf43 homolog [Saccostrea echinata]|uniref:protein C1orf43 homolog n=1 Tax=Saccostrea echinata TaxID=191078 RepID=UPI002A82CC73|nr:protein C1orf43 homolog [Saccostrea echinata]XP_061174165.1 protein C1orf43 homolog [Saccostrea echinata]